MPPITTSNSTEHPSRPVRGCCEKIPPCARATIVIITILLLAEIAFFVWLGIRSGGIYRDCEHAKSENNLNSNIMISPDGGTAFRVACNHTVEGGGWTIIQRRHKKGIDFNNGWCPYKVGFGSPTGELWLGNENIYKLTNNRNQMLLVILQIKTRKVYTAMYGRFAISDETQKYKLKISEFRKGNASNGLAQENDVPFSTEDMDNDSQNDTNCGKVRAAGWWYGWSVVGLYCGGTFINSPWGSLQWYYPSIGHIVPTHSTMMVKKRT